MLTYKENNNLIPSQQPYLPPIALAPFLPVVYLFSILIKFTSIKINFTPLLTHIARMIIFVLYSSGL